MIIGCYFPEVGGNEKLCSQIAAGLTAKGRSVAVLTEYRPGLPGYEVVQGIPVHRYLKGWHWYEYTYMLSAISFLLRNRRSYDAVVCFGLYLFTAPAVMVCKAMGKNIVFAPSSSGSTGDFYRIAHLRTGAFIRWCGRRADGIVAISRAIHDELLDNGYPLWKITNIPNGVDISHFSPGPSIPEQPLTVCYVGRLTEGKGVETLLEALRIAREDVPAIRGLIVGGGPLEKALRHRTEQLGLAGQVLFAGEVGDVAPYYRQAQVFALPSFSEGMPLALLEAMACGLCAVATPVGGILDIIREPVESAQAAAGYRVCENGILTPPGNAAALADALKLLARDAALRNRLACAGRATVCERHSIENVIERYDRLLRAGPYACTGR